MPFVQRICKHCSVDSEVSVTVLYEMKGEHSILALQRNEALTCINIGCLDYTDAHTHISNLVFATWMFFLRFCKGICFVCFFIFILLHYIVVNLLTLFVFFVLILELTSVILLPGWAVTFPYHQELWFWAWYNYTLFPVSTQNQRFTDT